MRIIAGEFRRRLIKGPEGNDTRPMTDRVRTSLFDRLYSMGALDTPAAVDIFAGTGSVGIEALSRGVEHVTFIERDRSAKTILQENLNTLGIANRGLILASNALSPAWINLLPRKPVGLFFLDPPYPMSDDEKQRPQLSELMDHCSRIATEDATLLLRVSEHAEALPSETWSDPESFQYGSTVLHFYSRK